MMESNYFVLVIVGIIISVIVTIVIMSLGKHKKEEEEDDDSVESDVKKRENFYRLYGSSNDRITSVEELFDRNEKDDAMFAKISKHPKIASVLRKHRKRPEDIKDIYWVLAASGASEYVAKSVIGNPQLLSEYLQMKRDGVPDLEIAVRLQKSMGL